jgi:hypothetical protein
LTNPKRIDKRYKKELKMMHKHFYKILDILSHFIEKKDTKMRQVVLVDKKKSCNCFV